MRPELKKILVAAGIGLAILIIAGTLPIQPDWQRAAQSLAAMGTAGAAILIAWVSFFPNRLAGREAVRAAVAFNVVVFVTLGLASVVVATPGWPTGVLWGAACLLAGGLVGVLFGVPMRQKSSGVSSSGNLVTETVDTASKFIAGFSVANYDEIAAQFKESAAYLARSLNWREPAGNPDQYSALAGGIILYFSILGFMAGLLLAHYYEIRLGGERGRGGNAAAGPGSGDTPANAGGEAPAGPPAPLTT